MQLLLHTLSPSLRLVDLEKLLGYNNRSQDKWFELDYDVLEKEISPVTES